jgi:uncharacterized membrane protein
MGGVALVVAAVVFVWAVVRVVQGLERHSRLKALYRHYNQRADRR